MVLKAPFGMVVFAMTASLPDDVSLEDISIGSAPCLIVLLVVLEILVAVTPITIGHSTPHLMTAKKGGVS